MTVQDDVVLREDRDGVALLTLNRPERANAWNQDMEIRYFDLIAEIDGDPDVRAVVVTGAGDRAFCPGVDMGILSDVSKDRAQSNEWRTRPMTFALTLRKPLIAAINGACAGVGLVQALVCDLRFAAAGINIATAFTRRGLPAEFGSSWLLQRLVGQSHAADLLLSARKVSAEEALAMGLVNRVLPREELLDAAMAYAADLAANCSPVAMAAVKRQLMSDWFRRQEESEAEAILLVRDPIRREDFTEGVDSYVQKRPPRFRGLPPRSVFF